MKKTLILACALALASCRAPATEMAATQVSAPLGVKLKVTGVYDGDTFTFDSSEMGPFASLSWKVRVAGIDTPEKKSDCRAEKMQAEKATLMARKLFRQSKDIVYISDIEHDKYGGRILARVTLADGRDYVEAMSKAGLARPYHGEKKRPWCDARGNLTPK